VQETGWISAGCKRWGCCSALTAVCLLGSVVARAEAPQDADRSDQPKTRWLSLDHLDAFLELENDYHYNRVDTAARFLGARRGSQTNREWGFEERVGFNLAGAIVDPGLMTFAGDLSFALAQDHFEEFGTGLRTRRDTDRGVLLQYDMRVNFFQGKLISGSVYGLRQDDRINRRFQPALDEERSGFGTSWVFAHDRIPMELSYDFLQTDRTGNRDKRDNEEFQESTFHYAVRYIVDEHHRLKLSYEHAETEQDFQGRRRQFETIRDLMTIEHEVEFGNAYQHAFRTLIHWLEESGAFARDFFEIGPQLTLKHSDTLQTLYKFQFNRERFAGLDIETQRADFQLVHQVYSNLTTTVDAFALYEDVENDINTTQYGASVDWQYNRKNRFGHFYANLALAYDTEDVSGDNGRRVILDEAHTFQDPLAVFLRNRRVIPFTIVVTDAGNRRIYQLGVDYLVFRRGNVTRISRIRTGRIADRDTIFVDYLFKTPSNGSLDTVRADFSLEQRFDNGLTPYYRLSYRNQEDDLSAGFARQADRTNHHRLGVTYEKTRFTLGTEYEDFDDSIDPFRAFHLNGLWHIIMQQDRSLDLSARLSRFDFTNGFDDRNVTFLDITLDHRWHLGDALSTVQRLSYRIEEDSLSGTTQGWDVSAGVEYAWGDLFAEITLEYDRLDLPYSDDEDFGVYFRLRREFGNILARR